MRTLIILCIIGITACNASKPSGSLLEPEKLAKEYRVDPDESVLEVVIESVEKNNDSYILKANVKKIINIGFGFKQISENQVLEIRSDRKAKKDDQLFAVVEYSPQQSGPEYSLRKTF